MQTPQARSLRVGSGRLRNVTIAVLAIWTVSMFLPVVVGEGGPFVAWVGILFYGAALVSGHVPDPVFGLCVFVAIVGYAAVPASIVCVRRSADAAGAVLAWIGFVAPLSLLVTGALPFHIRSHLDGTLQGLATGLVLWIASAGVMAAVATGRVVSIRSAVSTTPDR